MREQPSGHAVYCVIVVGRRVVHEVGEVDAKRSVDLKLDEAWGYPEPVAVNHSISLCAVSKVGLDDDGGGGVPHSVVFIDYSGIWWSATRNNEYRQNNEMIPT